MMKIFYRIMIIFALLLLVSCSNANNDGSNNDYSKYLSDQDGKYSLYIVAETIDNITFESLKENDINNVKTITQETSISAASLDEIKKIPTYIVFDTQSKVFKTNDIGELYKFLEDNK